MDTLNFDFLHVVDGSIERAQAQFRRREYSTALNTIAEMPLVFRARPDVLEVEARSYRALGDYQAAIAGWERLLKIDPDNKDAQAQLSACYAKVGADEVFRDVIPKFKANKKREVLRELERGPAEWRKHPEFYRLKALSHESVGEYDEAMNAWRALLALAPDHMEASARVCVCLTLTGRRDEAARAMRALVERYPKYMYAQFNWVSFRLDEVGIGHGLQIALTEVEGLRALSCNSHEFKAQLELFRTKLLALVPADELLRLDTEDALQLRTRPMVIDGSLRSLYEQFEPVGNDCQFGSAQRKHGAEPLALFRWAALTPDNLVRLMKDRLEGYDSPAHYWLERSPQMEFILRESAYHTHSHTRVNVSDLVDEAALLAQLTRRQAFLKRKFLDTAAEGQKIFIYKFGRRLDSAQLDVMQEAIRCIGVRKFLVVMPGDDEDMPGSIRAEAPDRVVGFLPDLMLDTQFGHWDSIVKKTFEYFKKR